MNGLIVKKILRIGSSMILMSPTILLVIKANQQQLKQDSFSKIIKQSNKSGIIIKKD